MIMFYTFNKKISKKQAYSQKFAKGYGILKVYFLERQFRVDEIDTICFYRFQISLEKILLRHFVHIE